MRGALVAVGAGPVCVGSGGGCIDQQCRGGVDMVAGSGIDERLWCLRELGEGEAADEMLGGVDVDGRLILQQARPVVVEPLSDRHRRC